MVEMEDFKYGGTNITAFRLVDPGSELVQQVFKIRQAITCRYNFKRENITKFSNSACTAPT